MSSPTAASADTETSTSSSSLSCRSCVRLLQEILDRPDSRPRAYLHAMMQSPHSPVEHSNGVTRMRDDESSRTPSKPTACAATSPAKPFRYKSTVDGIQVEIPAPLSIFTVPQRRWTRLLEPIETQFTTSVTDSATPLSVGLARKETTLQATSVLTTTVAVGAATTPTTTTNGNSHAIVRSQRASSPNPTRRSHSTTVPPPSAPNPTEWLQISCKACLNQGPEGSARAFVMGPTPLSVVVCHNRLTSPPHDPDSPTTTPSRYMRSTPHERALDEMSEILTHELTHVYDVRMLQLDLRDCENLAYSEVRAARQAECANSWMPQSCIRQKALTATHNLFPDHARQCVQRVLEQAMKDTRPFPPAHASKTASGGGGASYAVPEPSTR